MPNQPVEISVVVPALNEAVNLPHLVRRIDGALSGRSYEILIVDDASRDDTVPVCAALAKQYPVQLHVRERPTAGLSGAVLHGMERATGEFIAVMDADLQHPPEKLPELIRALISDECDFALGSRYVAGGSTGSGWTLFRRLNSWVATVLARPFTGRVSDPMSGFFALRRSTYEGAQRLTPLGYKIGLELICKCRVKQVKEIPIHFAERTAGESKLSMKQQFKYLEHLSRLYDFCFPRISPMLKFALVTGASWLVGFAIFTMMMTTRPQAAVAPVSVAYLGAIAVTMIFHTRYVRTQREFLVRKHPWTDFLFSSLAEWSACSLAAVYIGSRVLHPYPLELFMIPFSVAMAVRYILRKEFLLDIRGLRSDVRMQEMQ